MKLGCFSVSLAVKDLAASMVFYRALGFEPVAGDPSQNFVIMQNGPTKIGLFQGMFDDNLMTFNPGWSENAEPLDDFTDVRELKAKLAEAGIEAESAPIESDKGPGHFVVVDPDGNHILFDQHV